MMTVTTTRIPEKVQRTWTCDWCHADEVTVDRLRRPIGWFVVELDLSLAATSSAARLKLRGQESSTHPGDFRHMCPACGRERLTLS